MADAASVQAGTQKRRSRGIPERRLATLMVAPSLFLIALVALWPIVYAIWLSLHEYSLIQAGVSRFAEPFGLGNYQDALASSEFWRATRITFIFTIASVFLETLLGLAMALIMHSAFKGQGLLRTVVLVPWAVLTVVTAIMWRTIFDPNLGFVNTLLGTDIVWLGEEPYALLVMIFADVWKTAPFMALLLLAGLVKQGSDTIDRQQVAILPASADQLDADRQTVVHADRHRHCRMARKVERRDERIARLLHRALHGEGFQVVRTATGQEGLTSGLNGGFDLVPGVLDAIENGLAQWSIAQNPFAQGWVTSALIHMAIENGYPPFSYDTGAAVVDASNIGAVVEREAQFE